MQNVNIQETRPFWRRHYVFSSLLVAVAGTTVCSIFYEVVCGRFFSGSFLDAVWKFNVLGEAVVWGMVLGPTLGYAVVLTLIEIFLLFRFRAGAFLKTETRVFDAITIILGIGYSCLYHVILENVTGANWNVVLANAERHTPVYSGGRLTILVIACIALLGYLLLTYLPLQKLPPLIIVFGIAAMYLGNALHIIWLIQIYELSLDFLPMLLFPLNWLVMTVRTIITKIAEWNTWEHPESNSAQPFLRACSRILGKASLWPWAAFLLMWPLLGLLICILALFGQAPNAVIKAWTETSDWNLSQRVSPQNIYYDEHYLCTVAAGGHERVVKPKRMGIRHGYPVIVNRQLCIANAFEQVLEESTPRFHRAVRHFYDTYGFPVARKIRSPYTADLIYFLMKPLEWFFLFVLYAVDVHPEDRIAVQYTGKRVEDVLG